MSTDLIGQLAQTGILGLLLALALVAVIYLYRQVLEEKDGRRNDLREFIEADGVFKTEIKNFMQAIRDMLTQKK